jgi:hypothetical protein
MRKKIIIVFIILIAVGTYLFRHELLFQFQYVRLKSLSCQADSTDFSNDSCLNKVWPHRVNSIDRYNILKGKFAGAETDVVWDKNEKQFLVYHPPLEHKAILLDSFLSFVDTEKELLWLDTRAIPVGDTLNVLNELHRLNATHQLKMNAILEIYNLSVANFLADKGYWVALNINSAWIEKYNNDDWKKLNEAMSPGISFVSQEDIHIPLLKKHFPAKDIITWSIAFKNYFDRKHLKQLVQDDKVKVVLVNIKSRYYQ